MLQLIRLPEVIESTGMKRPTVYAAMGNCLFPRPIKLGRKLSAWPLNEVQSIIAARIAGKSNEEIRALVAELTEARKNCLAEIPA